MAKTNKIYSKTVLLPIKVTPRKHCWEWTGDRAICEHFDNEGGHPTCDLKFHIDASSTDKKIEKDGGILKPEECAKLEEEK